MIEMKKYRKTAALLLLVVMTLAAGCMRSDDDIETMPEDTDPAGTISTPDETEETIETEDETETDDGWMLIETEDGAESESEEVPETNARASLPDDGSGMVHTIELDKGEVNITVGLSDMPWVTMYPSDAPDKSEIWESSDPDVAVVDEYGRIKGIAPGTCTVSVAAGARPELKAELEVTVHPREEIEEPTYIDGILVVNKTYALPEDYNPGIDPEAQAALDEMTAAAALEDIELFVVSGFRSFETQTDLYNRYVARDGKDEADKYSARPGNSEHQTGLAFDLNSLEQSFGETAEGKWLAANCAEYGFIIRYQKDKEDITGYIYEPWHIRYLGEETAKKVYESGLCLEEYLDITSEYEY